MVSIKELREVCQKPQDCHNYQSVIGEFYRVFSIYITKILIYMRIQANHVTMVMIFWGFLVGFLFSIGTYRYILIGAILLEFLFVIDLVDGELARYNKTPSLRGIFLDLVAHSTNFAGPFIGLTIGLYKLNPRMDIVVLGLSVSTFSVLCLTIQALKHHVIVKELVRHSQLTEKTKSIKLHMDVGVKRKMKKITSLKSFGRMVNYLYDEFYAVKLILLAAIFNQLYWILVFYGLTFPIMWFIKLIYEYKTGYSAYEYLLKPYKN